MGVLKVLIILFGMIMVSGLFSIVVTAIFSAIREKMLGGGEFRTKINYPLNWALLAILFISSFFFSSLSFSLFFLDQP